MILKTYYFRYLSHKNTELTIKIKAHSKALALKKFSQRYLKDIPESLTLLKILNQK